jgi:predicted  nucleic acid-binding Zn-ribbon protein
MTSLKEEIKNLLALQDIDTHIEVIRQERDEAPKRVSEMEKMLSRKEARASEAQEVKDSLEEKKLKLDEQIKESRRKTKKSQSRLNDVKNHRQQQAVLKEIEDLQMIKEEAEEAMLKVVDELELVDAQLESALDGLPELKKNLDDERSKLENSVNEMNHEISKLDGERDQFTKNLSQMTLDRYNFIRSRLSDAAIAPVIEGTCQVCHMTLPPQNFIELRRMEELMTCPSCSRIIYYVEIDQA